MAPKRGITVRWPEDVLATIQDRADRFERSFGQEAIFLVKKGLELAQVEESGAAKARETYFSTQSNGEPEKGKPPTRRLYDPAVHGRMLTGVLKNKEVEDEKEGSG